jgi:hypothetical protein
MNGMKSLSSAIVVAAGVYGIAQCPVGTGFFLGTLGFSASLAVTALGLVGWWACLKHEK